MVSDAGRSQVAASGPRRGIGGRSRQVTIGFDGERESTAAAGAAVRHIDQRRRSDRSPGRFLATDERQLPESETRPYPTRPWSTLGAWPPTHLRGARHDRAVPPRAPFPSTVPPFNSVLALMRRQTACPSTPKVYTRRTRAKSYSFGETKMMTWRPFRMARQVRGTCQPPQNQSAEQGVALDS